MIMTVPRLSQDELVSLVGPDEPLEDDGCAAIFAEAFALDETAAASEEPYEASEEPSAVPEVLYEVSEEACGSFAAFMMFQDAPGSGLVHVEIPAEVSEEASALAAFMALQAADGPEVVAAPAEVSEEDCGSFAPFFALEDVQTSEVVAAPAEVPAARYEVPEEACGSFTAFLAFQDVPAEGEDDPTQAGALEPAGTDSVSCAEDGVPAVPATEPGDIPVALLAAPAEEILPVPEAPSVEEVPVEEAPVEEVPVEEVFVVEDAPCTEPVALLATPVVDEVPETPEVAPIEEAPSVDEVPAPVPEVPEDPVAVAVLDSAALVAEEAPVFGASVVFSFGKGDGERSELYSF